MCGKVHVVLWNDKYGLSSASLFRYRKTLGARHKTLQVSAPLDLCCPLPTRRQSVKTGAIRLWDLCTATLASRSPLCPLVTLAL